jgi:hypothetical protein
VIDIYDTEIDKILGVQAKLQQRASEGSRNYNDFEREIKERFEDIGFTVQVVWHSYAIGRVVQQGSAMPEVTITGRTDPKFQFDPDQQVHEVTANVLGIPGEEGVIKTDLGDSFKHFREGHGDGGHGHPHSH